MSVGAICFTSSGSNGGCWVVLVFPRLFFFFFLEKWVFFPHTRLTPRKKIYATYAKKKIKKRLTLISTIELRIPHLRLPHRKLTRHDHVFVLAFAVNEKLQKGTIFLYLHLPQKTLQNVQYFCTRMYRKKNYTHLQRCRVHQFPCGRALGSTNT